MATYAIGDLQGCHDEFLALLDAIDFHASRDRLWLTGDLVNRGPRSLAVLRTVIGLGDAAVTVLGNHDLHLLALAMVPGLTARRRDTLAEVLAAPDSEALLDWLRACPLLHHDTGLGYAMVHAGLPPQWTLAEATEHAAEVERALRDEPSARTFLAAMYGDEPRCWDPRLQGPERLRFITNCLTRMRYCDEAGNLDLDCKGAPDTVAPPLRPWFAVAGRASRDVPIVFGHWSTLRLDEADCARFNVYPLDTGAVWGGELTAMRLEDGARFQVPSAQALATD